MIARVVIVEHQRVVCVEQTARIERFDIGRRASHKLVVEEEAEQQVVHGVTGNQQGQTSADWVLDQGGEGPAAPHDGGPEGNDHRHDDALDGHGRQRPDPSEEEKVRRRNDHPHDHCKQHQQPIPSRAGGATRAKAGLLASPGDANDNLHGDDADEAVCDAAQELSRRNECDKAQRDRDDESGGDEAAGGLFHSSESTTESRSRSASRPDHSTSW